MLVWFWIQEQNVLLEYKIVKNTWEKLQKITSVNHLALKTVSNNEGKYRLKPPKSFYAHQLLGWGYNPFQILETLQFK